VVAFHSLEDRIVKRFFADRSGGASGSRHLPDSGPVAASFATPQRGALAASEEEAQRNPRARSAKLRYGIRTGEPAFAEDWTPFKLPNLVSLSSLGRGGRDG
jgi:16S rRNA (cytosine1402-N4)-methyltransferase